MLLKSLANKAPLIIAEVAQAHDGSLGNAHAFIDAAANAGADAIKFQTHIASAESTYDEPWRVKFSRQDNLRYEYWKRMEFTREQWQGLYNHAKEKGLIFLSSPFSLEAVDLLVDLGIETWKIASGELYNTELLEAIWKTGLPVLYSSGMSTFEELRQIIRETESRNIPYGLFQCTTEYPCKPEHWGLNIIGEMKKEFGVPVGLSDHSGSIYAGLAATALGAEFIEVHVAYSRQMFGPDTSASITFEELKSLVEGSRTIHTALSNPLNKNEFSKEISGIRKIFGRSVALRDNLPKGTVIERQHLVLKKPGGGILPSEINSVVGGVLRSDKQKEKLLTWDDFEK